MADEPTPDQEPEAPADAGTSSQEETAAGDQPFVVVPLDHPLDGDVQVRLIKAIAEQLSVNERDITLDAAFIEDLNADSLDLVELVMTLEEDFKTKITDEDAEKLVTVRAVMDYLHQGKFTTTD